MLCVAPVISWGRCLAAFELLDPLDAPFDARATSAIAHVAERFADYLAERGIAVGFRIASR